MTPANPHPPCRSAAPSAINGGRAGDDGCYRPEGRAPTSPWGRGSYGAFGARFCRSAALSAITAVLYLTTTPAAAQPTVTVDGRVAKPGAHALQPGARLFDAAHAGGVKPDAYLTGAAWLRRDELKPQRALKVGLLFDLRTLEQGAFAEGDEALAALAGRLAAQVGALPVTGRRRNTLDPVRLELEPRSNRPLGAGDRLIYPPRPATVTVTGAVEADCVLPFAGLRPAAAYAADCPRHAAADRDWLYVIQPDGVVSRHGVAGWNRDPAQPLAPGARVYVPLRQALVEGRADELNDDFAAFLATQPLPIGEGGR